MIQNGDNNSISLWYHEGYLKDLAHKIKDNDAAAIRQAAELLSKHVHKSFCLVPIPSHLGMATNTLELCRNISEITGCSVCDALQGEARESLYQAKLEGRDIDVSFFKVSDTPACRKVLLVDNVIHTAKTVKAARKALGINATILTLTISNK